MAELDNPLMPPVDRGDPDMEADLPSDVKTETDEEPSDDLLEGLDLDEE